MGPTFMDVLLGIAPLLVLVAAVVFIMPILSRRLTGSGSASARHIEQLELQTRALERIADALEKRGAP